MRTPDVGDKICLDKKTVADDKNYYVSHGFLG
jgi:hypothetical protein